MWFEQKDQKAEKPKLSPEEARKQADELLRKAKEKREVCSSSRTPLVGSSNATQLSHDQQGSTAIYSEHCLCPAFGHSHRKP